MSQEHYLCTSCKYVGPRATVKRGSAKMDGFLWLFVTPVAPFYTLWRIFSKKMACPECSEAVMVAYDETSMAQDGSVASNAPLNEEERSFELPYGQTPEDASSTSNSEENKPDPQPKKDEW